MDLFPAPEGCNWPRPSEAFWGDATENPGSYGRARLIRRSRKALHPLTIRGGAAGDGSFGPRSVHAGSSRILKAAMAFLGPVPVTTTLSDRWMVGQDSPAIESHPGPWRSGRLSQVPVQGRLLTTWGGNSLGTLEMFQDPEQLGC